MKKKEPKRDLYSRLIASVFGVECVAEFRFHPVRLWRFDYAIPDLKIAIEIDGGVFILGRHNRPTGYLKDLEKFNEAAAAGWVVLKFTPQQKEKNEALDIIARTIKNRKSEGVIIV